MSVAEVTAVLGWCVVFNGTIFLLWAGAFLFFPGLVFRTQERWFPATREQFTLVFYGFLGLFKILFLIFILTPYLALKLVG
jgi:hypothetical protein